MIRIFGGVVVFISSVGIYFFGNYSGKMISHPNLWLLVFVTFSLLGIWMITGFFRDSEKKTSLKSQQDRTQFKENADKIILDIDSCRFLSGSSFEQIEKNEDLSTLMILTPYTSGELGDTSAITEVETSCLTYDITTGKKVIRYTSQEFPFSQITLETYVMEHKVCLYIDRFDVKKYVFDINV